MSSKHPAKDAAVLRALQGNYQDELNRKARRGKRTRKLASGVVELVASKPVRTCKDEKEIEAERYRRQMGLL